MSTLRAFFVITLIGAATVGGGASAAAEPVPLEPFVPAHSGPVAETWCNAHPLIQLWCFVSQSA
ncbi:hypothetical protein [Nocardia sp. NPDC057227]|uniref:hypothetical protein n=1 Tax=Nocardia sp. NPDC057227 TaxID=3346056 RepID=UPI00363B3E23